MQLYITKKPLQKSFLQKEAQAFLTHEVTPLPLKSFTSRSLSSWKGWGFETKVGTYN